MTVVGLVTGNFAILAVSTFAQRCIWGAAGCNQVWGFIGNLLGGVVHAFLLVIILTKAWRAPLAGVSQKRMALKA